MSSLAQLPSDRGPVSISRGKHSSAGDTGELTTVNGEESGMLVVAAGFLLPHEIAIRSMHDDLACTSNAASSLAR
eukprot:CAMPEP_0115881350 /NCGR_PEP_ID=MMETSP0287-20121206/28384_1 /TAXON_ID=412157 /ORGANISM="Chrysochromulina rotalis, Strain UIO044" /LENGTH=74 /DNA_ID=CAMNT_0003337275 /DNA_START=12 /DNA_END=232 /DNA_ORIENTATION=-